jgi:hypothetical protein
VVHKNECRGRANIRRGGRLDAGSHRGNHESYAGCRLPVEGILRRGGADADLPGSKGHREFRWTTVDEIIYMGALALLPSDVYREWFEPSHPPRKAISSWKHGGSLRGRSRGISFLGVPPAWFSTQARHHGALLRERQCIMQPSEAARGPL